MNNGEAPASGLDDPRLRSAFGFDHDEESWLGVVRRANRSVTLGSLGPYELLGEAGRGAQGTVYKAAHRRTGRIVALKRLPFAGCPSASARARFETEIEAACALDHPGVVRVYTADVIDGHAVIAMEWVDGAAIDQWAEHGGRTPAEIANLFALVCDAVAHAHHRGVIHRDLKPSNIMVGTDGRPRVLDFGLAKVLGDAEEASITRVSGLIGTPAYAAPEQIAGGPADTRSDVYSLGVVLHRLLGGRHPFETHAAVAALFDQVRAGVRRGPAAHRAGVGSELDAIVLRACALEAADRYPSAEALADDLRRFLTGRTVTAHPPSAWYRLRKAARRHRRTTAAVIMTAILLITCTAVVSMLAVRLSAQRAQLARALQNEHAALVQSQESRQAESDARHAADQSAATAQDAAHRSASTLAFLQRIVEEAGGIRDPKSDVPMRDVLARAVAELDAGNLADQPDAEMDLRITIGASYRALGLLDQAEPQMRRALQMAELLHGQQSHAYARALEYLGRLLELAGRLREAEELERRGLAVRAVADGPDSMNYAGALSDLASVLDEEGRYSESEAMYVAGRAITASIPGAHAMRLAIGDRNIGLELLEQGRWEEAEWRTLSAIQAIEQEHREHTDPHFRAVRNLARIYSATGRGPAAAAMLSDVIERWAAQIGPDHPQIGRERAILAGIIARTGNMAEAERVYSTAIDALRRRLPDHHPWIVRSRIELARALVEDGRDQSALTVANQALSDALAAPPGAESLGVSASHVLADCLVATGQNQMAAVIVHSTAAILAHRVGPEDPRVRACLQLEASLGADCP